MMSRIKRLVLIIRVLLNRNIVCQNSDRHFFIIGSGRCGSTLLRVVLERHKQVAILPEINEVFPTLIEKVVSNGNQSSDDWFQLFWDSYSATKNWDQLNLSKSQLKDLYGTPSKPLPHFLELLHAKYGEKKSSPKLLYGDKHPYLTFYIPYLKSAFPKAKFIHLIRDGRDVATSWYKTETLSEDLEFAAKRWNWALKEVERFKFLIKRQLIEIKYESLVQDPETTLKKISAFLDIPYSSDFFDSNINQSSSETNVKHHAGSGNPISTKSIGKWQHSLTNEEQNRILPILERRLRKYGYL